MLSFSAHTFLQTGPHAWREGLPGFCQLLGLSSLADSIKHPVFKPLPPEITQSNLAQGFQFLKQHNPFRSFFSILDAIPLNKRLPLYQRVRGLLTNVQVVYQNCQRHLPREPEAMAKEIAQGLQQGKLQLIPTACDGTLLGASSTHLSLTSTSLPLANNQFGSTVFRSRLLTEQDVLAFLQADSEQRIRQIIQGVTQDLNQVALPVARFVQGEGATRRSAIAALVWAAAPLLYLQALKDGLPHTLAEEYAQSLGDSFLAFAKESVTEELIQTYKEYRGQEASRFFYEALVISCARSLVTRYQEEDLSLANHRLRAEVSLGVGGLGIKGQFIAYLDPDVHLIQHLLLVTKSHESSRLLQHMRQLFKITPYVSGWTRGFPTPLQQIDLIWEQAVSMALAGQDMSYRSPKLDELAVFSLQHPFNQYQFQMPFLTMNLSVKGPLTPVQDILLYARFRWGQGKKLPLHIIGQEGDEVISELDIKLD